MTVTPQTPFGQEPIIDRTAQTDPRVYGDRPEGAASIKGILLHHTGSANEQGDYSWLSQYHANPVSIHKLLQRDGTAIQIVKNEKRAYHAGRSNWPLLGDCGDTMIGYEICNRGDGEAFSASQYEMVARMVAYDTARYHIPSYNVTMHRLVALPYGRKNDPLGFDLARMWARVHEIRQAWPAAWGLPQFVG